MNTFDFEELKFEESKHVYTLGGIQIPSVTTIMRPLSNALYGGVDESVLNKAANRGTAVHNAIENYLDFGIADIDPTFLSYFEAFLEWKNAVNPIVHGTEKKVYHKVYRYAGTADLIATIDDKRYLIDYKTSATVNEMLTGVQLSAYAKAFESHGIEFDGTAILHLKPNGKYDWVEYPINDYESWDTFCACLTVYNHVQKYRWRNVS